MTGHDQDLDRNEQASPHKLEEARKRGQSARSTDLGSLAALIVAMLACYALATPALKAMTQLLAQGLAVSPTVVSDSAQAAQLGQQGLSRALLVLAPFLLALVVVTVGVSLLQSGGFVFTSQPLKPDFTRLNPAQGFKKFFSMRLIYEAIKSTLKLLALAGVAWLALQALLFGALQLLGLPAKALLFRTLQASGGVMAKLCAVLLVFALIDLLFVRWEFLRKLRMSKREVEDEHKNREGDPRIKNRLRELRQQFLQRSQSVRNVPQSNVVITNPTHIAVALRYEHGVTPAPLLVAKGAGAMAAQIRKAAQKAGVPIVHSPRLARALFREVGQDAYVPEHWYPPVARILVWLRSAREAKARQTAALGAALGASV